MIKDWFVALNIGMCNAWRQKGLLETLIWFLIIGIWLGVFFSLLYVSYYFLSALGILNSTVGTIIQIISVLFGLVLGLLTTAWCAYKLWGHDLI